VNYELGKCCAKGKICKINMNRVGMIAKLSFVSLASQPAGSPHVSLNLTKIYILNLDLLI
jgi:hypothetical protein